MRPSHHSRLLIVCGVLLIGAVVAGIVFAISNLRERALTESERELANTVRILSEQIDRTFQAISLVQEVVTDDIQALGITARELAKRTGVSTTTVHNILGGSRTTTRHLPALLRHRHLLDGRRRARRGGA